MSKAGFQIAFNNIKEIALAYFPDEEDAEAREQFVLDATKELLCEYNASPEELIYGRGIAAVYKQLKDESCLVDEVTTLAVTSTVDSVLSTSSSDAMSSASTADEELSPASTFAAPNIFSTDAASSESFVSTDTTTAVPECSPPLTDGALSSDTTPSASITVPDAASSVPTATASNSTSASSDVATVSATAADLRRHNSVALSDFDSVDQLFESVAAKTHNSADIPNEDSVASCEFTSTDTHLKESAALRDLASAENNNRRVPAVSSISAKPSADNCFNDVASLSNCQYRPATPSTDTASLAVSSSSFNSELKTNDSTPSVPSSDEFYNYSAPCDSPAGVILTTCVRVPALTFAVSSAEVIEDSSVHVLALDLIPVAETLANHDLIYDWASGPGPPVEVIMSTSAIIYLQKKKMFFN